VPARRLSVFRNVALLLHLKERARVGARLSGDELAFIGLTEWQQPKNGHWRSANGLTTTNLEDIIGEQDMAMMQALMSIGHADQVEFMGS
jgi:hypothetical protein